MLKKCILLLNVLMLIGCLDRDRMAQMFELAKQNPNRAVCFQMYRPNSLTGRYCIIRTEKASWNVSK